MALEHLQSDAKSAGNRYAGDDRLKAYAVHFKKHIGVIGSVVSASSVLSGLNVFSPDEVLPEESKHAFYRVMPGVDDFLAYVAEHDALVLIHDGIHFNATMPITRSYL